MVSQLLPKHVCQLGTSHISVLCITGKYLKRYGAIFAPTMFCNECYRKLINHKDYYGTCSFVASDQGVQNMLLLTSAESVLSFLTLSYAVTVQK